MKDIATSDGKKRRMHGKIEMQSEAEDLFQTRKGSGEEATKEISSLKNESSVKRE